MAHDERTMLVDADGHAEAPTSPLTGWDRARWAAFADRLLRSVRPYASPGHGRITVPGPEGGYGRDIDGLEGFARTFLAAGFRLAGERGQDPDNLAEWYAQGIATGTDPSVPDRWVRLSEHPQAKVEAASIALVLDMTRPWIWDRLDSPVQDRVVDYLAEAVGDHTYPRINWVWFRLVVETFLKSVGGPYSSDDMADDLATHDSFFQADGWISDGFERAFDHYVGWALHLYPTLWARMDGAQELAAPRRERDRQLLDRYLQDAITLVGADGGPLVQGRSLIYRFAAAAPFWVGAIAQVPSVAPGVLRRAASGIVKHFAEQGVPDERGLLTTGWFGSWQGLAQAYSGTGSPYWASKGLLGLSLPADHPAWTAVEQPLPVERGDVLRSVRGPGWLIAGTLGDGIVRIVNHGTDHAVEGDRRGDSGLYARIGYSTATAPWLDEASWASPVDQSAVLLDGDGRATHRTGLTRLALRVEECADGTRVGVGGSRAAAHWLTPDVEQWNHGYGWTGEATDAGTLTVVSLVRGPWEVRLVRVDSLADDATTVPTRLRVGGWATVDGDGLTSSVLPLTEALATGSEHRTGASILGEASTTPWADFPVHAGGWSAALVVLEGTPSSRTERHEPSLDIDARHPSARVVWPDGVTTTTDLP
ncbi:DUF2264 domain-containing protein [Cellulomonas sp. 73-92]|uniref:DUF2264 domain-containing protein n=1 Tax=Cellulomonas sp. 73-92 TaxID=1895740 RepID=UPI000AA9D8D9|nr:DUF2264 domain-containing protein [Cellulomonas sp. 73-92]